MSQTQLAGEPLGVARVDRSRRPQSRKLQSAIKSFLAAIGLAIRVLAGVAIVEAIAASSFGLVPGTLIAGTAALVMGITFLALGR